MTNSGSNSEGSGPLPVAVNRFVSDPDAPSVSRRRDRRVGDIGRDPARGRARGEDVVEDDRSRR
jgi:hypothetical protein